MLIRYAAAEIPKAILNPPLHPGGGDGLTAVRPDTSPEPHFLAQENVAPKPRSPLNYTEAVPTR